MKTVTIRLAAALIVIISFAACGQWRDSRTLPYCEVARNAERYHHSNIRVEATLFLGSNLVFIYEDCDPGEALASRVEISGSSVIDTEGEANQLLVPAQHSTLRKANAIVEGWFDAEFSTGCWGPKYRIVATRVSLLTPVADATPPLLSEDGLRLKH